MKIIVTGSNGLLGQKVVYGLLDRSNIDIVAIARGENRMSNKSGYHFISADLSDAHKVSHIIHAEQPDCIIHTAAMTNVDACENDPENCRIQNVNVVQFLVDACKGTSCHFVHLSTDFVFDGLNGPYRETDAVNPQSIYAQSKLDSEKIVEQSGLSYTIIRTIIIYGVSDDAQRSNVVLWTRNNLAQGKDIRVITDQYRSPTLAEDLADACIEAALRKAQGIYHVSGSEIMPIIEIAYRVADFFGLDKKYIQPVTTEELNQPAKRPLKTGFIIDKAMQDLDYKPHTLEEGLKVIAYQLSEKTNMI